MTASDSHVLLHAFCDELARCGLQDACTSPGSRSAPLVLALARNGRIACHSHIDERCAGFFAVGLAKTSRRAVAIACTSGTAGANLAPAVHEAQEARVPLIVLTADRPPELRERGAGQTIDQVELFGRAAKWFCEVGADRADADVLRWVRQLACRAWATAHDGRPGPVHLNFPLREPLVPAEELPDTVGGRADGLPLTLVHPLRPGPAHEAVSALGELVEHHPDGVVVCGRQERDEELGAAVADFAAAAGYPVLADPLSGCRHGTHAIAHYDLLLRDERFANSRPDLVIRVGDLPTSKPLRAWLATARSTQVALDAESAWQDPAGVLDQILVADPERTLATLAERITRPPGTEATERWSRADAAAAAVIEKALASELSEPAVARLLGKELPAGALLWVASSMPIRDVETYFPVREKPLRVLSNRGANGIDGTISSAYGAAARHDGPVVLLIGDVAFAHDIGGLLAGPRLELDLTIVLLNNDGGGIFHFLPIAGEQDVFERHVATPHGLDFAHAAQLFGASHEVVGSADALRAAFGTPGEGTRILEVRTDRARNRELHAQVAADVAAALG
jgi:2-succinyl-5-enolpyruvyl-6-hydroxy-3-cyclohexene-1-carboxylate synthase